MDTPEQQDPQNQVVSLQPVIVRPGVQGAEPLKPGPGVVIALHENEVVFTPPVPGPPLDVGVMEQQLIDSGVDEETRQAVMEKVVGAQIQFLAHQLSTITWFLEYEPLPLPLAETARPANKQQLHPYDPTHLQLKTVAYDHGRMEVTFKMGAHDDAPEGQTQESAADEAAAAEPAEDEDGSPVEQSRDVAAGAPPLSTR